MTNMQAGVAMLIKAGEDKNVIFLFKRLIEKINFKKNICSIPEEIANK